MWTVFYALKYIGIVIRISCSMSIVEIPLTAGCCKDCHIGQHINLCGGGVPTNRKKLRIKVRDDVFNQIQKLAYYPDGIEFPYMQMVWYKGQAMSKVISLINWPSRHSKFPHPQKWKIASVFETLAIALVPREGNLTLVKCQIYRWIYLKIIAVWYKCAIKLLL